MRTQTTGIEVRHARSCRARGGGRCNCEPSYRASAQVNGRREKRTFNDMAAAISWRKDAEIAMRRGREAPGRNTTTVREAWAEWQRLAGAGVIRAANGQEYKGATIRSYERHLRLRVLGEYGHEPLAELHRPDWQELVDNLLAEGAAPSTVNGAIAAVSALYEHEIRRGRLIENPARKVKMPAPNGRRERFATREEAAALIAALPDQDRAVWATAFYAGLRRGELQALRACDVGDVLSVQWGWDAKDGRIATKGRNRRSVPIPAMLKTTLTRELLRTGRRAEQLVFGRTEVSPFSPTRLTARADRAWRKAGLPRITLHECRHTYASLMIAAGANAKALSSYMGHASIQITYDRYGHLMPGNEAEAAGLMDAYLERSSG